MLVHRICARAFARLDGEGAKLYGGRWNSTGRPAIYTSENLSLAVLEMLFHVDLNLIPDDLVRLVLELPNRASIESYPKAQAPVASEARKYGDKWLAEVRSLALAVPSAVVPEQVNILINPLHPQMSMVKKISTKPLSLDQRLTERSRA